MPSRSGKSCKILHDDNVRASLQWSIAGEDAYATGLFAVL